MPYRFNTHIAGDNVLVHETSVMNSVKAFCLNNACIISLDGVDGVGKSTLAHKIAKEIGLKHFNLDKFLTKKCDMYIKYIDYEQLKKKIILEIQSNKTVVVEGICVKQILKAINLDPDLSIYIKILDRYGFWIHQILFPPDKSADEVINYRKDKGLPLGYKEDIIRYHYTFKPHKCADYIFVREKSPA